MPIKPENKHRYPPRREWRQIRAAILERAGGRCEFCGAEDRARRGGTLIILSIAHLDQAPENNDHANLAALCQKCHLNHDRPFNIHARRATFFQKARRHTLDMFGFAPEER